MIAWDKSNSMYNFFHGDLSFHGKDACFNLLHEKINSSLTFAGTKKLLVGFMISSLSIYGKLYFGIMHMSSASPGKYGDFTNVQYNCPTYWGIIFH